MPERSGGRARGRAAIGAVVLVSMVAAACSAAQSKPEAADSRPSGTSATVPDRENPSGPPKPGGQLTVGLAAETNSYNPYSGQWSNSSFTVANAIFEPLTAMDPVGIAKPYLAESIETTGDFKSWTITVRPGVVFHNGQKFDAAALKKNLDTGKTSGLTSQAFLPVESIEVVGERSVKVQMSKPWATFPATLAQQSGYMAAPAMLDDPAAANADPIGTGPFRFTNRVRDASLSTKKNPQYWRKDTNGVQLPYLDAVDFKVLADTTSRAASLRSGDIDAMDVLTPTELVRQTEAARKGEVQMITSANKEGDETVLAFNTTKEPFNDPIARQAMAYGIDQERISSTAYQGAFPGAWGMFEESSPYYISRQEAGYPTRDVSKAKELAKQYEQSHGKPLQFTALIPPDPEYLAIAQQVQADAKEFGVTVDLQAIEQSTLISKVIAAGDYQASGFVLWSSPSPDQSYVMIASKANPTGLSLNYTRFDDPEITAAMDEFRSASEPQKRIDAMKRVQKRLAEDKQVIFLVHTRSAFVYSNAVHGVKSGTTFPGTDVVAYGRYPTSPFYGAIWKDQSR